MLKPLRRCVPWILVALALLAPACSSGGGLGPNDILALCTKASTCTTPDNQRVSLDWACNWLTEAVPANLGKGTADQLVSALIDCIKNAKDCNAMIACVKATSAEAQVCTGAGGKARCSGSRIVECDAAKPDKTPDAFDCAGAGLVCGQGDTGAGCGTKVCNPDTDQAYCQGNLLFQCQASSKVLTSTDCGYAVGFHCTGISPNQSCQTRAGGTCGTDPSDGSIACVGTGAACDEASFQNRCDGTVMVTCNRGKESKLDCQAVTSIATCTLDSKTGAVTCDLAQKQCAPSSYNSSCQGAVATICLAGTITAIDCTSYGFSGCITQTVDSQTVASCVP